jgi:hypothetical protein
MFNPEEYVGYAEGRLDRYVKLRSRSGEKRRHWIYGNWGKGFPQPVAPTGRDWALEVEELTLQIRSPVVIRIVEERVLEHLEFVNAALTVSVSSAGAFLSLAYRSTKHKSGALCD